MTVASTTPISGLRERKKQRTRDALVDAAFEVCRRKGFEATTIDEIAEAVELAPRTFFRYFESKEDVALTLQDKQFEALYAAFAARPAHEPVLSALRHAAVATLRACEHGTGGVGAHRGRRGPEKNPERPARAAPTPATRPIPLTAPAPPVAGPRG